MPPSNLNLRAAEARALIDAARCEVVRVMRPQPVFAQVHEWKGVVIHDAEGREWCWKDHILGQIWDFKWDREEFAKLSPLPAPGSVVACREPINRPNNDAWLYSADHQPVMVNPASETAMIVWAHHKQQDHCTAPQMPPWAIRLYARVESRDAGQRGDKWFWVAVLVREKGGSE